MATRRFGPVRGAGTVIIEKEAAQTITPAALGVTAYSGIVQKGPVGKAFKCKTKKDFKFKAGAVIADSLLPDSAFDFFKLASGAGELWVNRVTDGSEKKASLGIKTRKTPRGLALTLEAGNGGRWAGKKGIIIDEYLSVTATTMTLDNPPAALKKDELAGAAVAFSAIPGKSYIVESNTALGVLSFASDVNLVADLGASVDKLLSVSLGNEGQSVAVLIREGNLKPTTEWSMDVYLVDGGVFEKAKTFENMSSDPAADNYYVKIINDDGDSEFLVKVVDEYEGSVSASIRPANVFGSSKTLTATVLTAKIHDEISNSVALAKMKADPLTLGASVIEDTVTLTCTAAGARALGSLTFGTNPDDGDAITLNGKVITFKAVVVTPASQVLIGATASATIDNLVTFINASTAVELKDKVFAEKFSVTVLKAYAQTAGTAGNAFGTLSSGGANKPTWGGATMAGGAAQTFGYSSLKMPFLTGLVVTSGVAFAAPNVYGAGFTLIDTTKDSTKMWAALDTMVIEVVPLELNALVDGLVYPKASEFRTKFKIVSNTADTITVKTGSDMTGDAAAGDDFRVEYKQELRGGYDGIASVTDAHYTAAYDVDSSPLKSLHGKNLGLVKLATPGITSTTVQKEGAAFAEANNWQYRYEVPANITDEAAVEEYINDTLGRNDYAVFAYPSYIKVSHPSGIGTKLVSATGGVHGVEANFARSFSGFHKAAAGVDAKLSHALALPDGLEDKVLDEESLNPLGAQVLKFKDGNLVIWGDRTASLDTNFKFKHVRETLSHYENIFLENFDFIIFALNGSNTNTRQRLLTAFDAFRTQEFAKQAIDGKDPSEAMTVKIDDENNTEATREDGDMNAEIGVRVIGVVERLIVTISRLGITESAG